MAGPAGGITPAAGLEYFTDFLGDYPSSAELNLVPIVPNTPVVVPDSELGHAGIYGLLGNAVAGITELELSTDGLVLTDGQWQTSVVCRFANTASANGSQPSRFYFGFLTMKPLGWNPATDASDGVLTGAFFSFNSQRAPYMLRCTVVNNGVISAQFQSAVAPNTNWHNYAVIGNAAGSSWSFYYDGGLMATLAGVPSVAGVVDAPYNASARPRAALRFLGSHTAASDLGVLVDAWYHKLLRNAPLAIYMA